MRDEVVRVPQATTQYAVEVLFVPSLVGMSEGWVVVVSVEKNLTMDAKESMSDEDDLDVRAAMF
jgi:hypothetical protein